MITAEHVLVAFQVLGRASVRHDYATPEALDAAAELYAVVMEDCTEEDLQAAVLGYLRAPLPDGQWSKPWPGPWALLKHVPARRLALVDDTVSAWSDVERWLRGPGNSAEYTKGGYRYPEPTEGAIDAENDKRDARLRTALANVGGNTAYRRTQVADQVWFRKRWEEAYREVTERAKVIGEGAAVLRLEDRRKGGTVKRLGGS